MPKRAKLAALVLIGTAAAIQFIRPERTNPPTDAASTFEAVAKPSAQTAAVVRRACQDCHSHATVWPWYSAVAPASWLVSADVREGRARLNLSQWNLLGPEMSALKMKQMCAEAQGGEMPLWQYRLIHGDAKLAPADIAALCAGPGAPSVVQ